MKKYNVLSRNLFLLPTISPLKIVMAVAGSRLGGCPLGSPLRFQIFDFWAQLRIKAHLRQNKKQNIWGLALAIAVLPTGHF